MFNIKKLAIASRGTMPVLDPKGRQAQNDDKQDLGITLMSPGTREYQAAKHKHDEVINKHSLDRMKGDKVPEGAAEKARAEFFAAVTISFIGFDYEGKADAYLAAYMDPEIDLAEQVNKYLGDRGNFFVPLANGSSNSSDTSPG